MSNVVSLIRRPTLRLNPADDVVIAARPLSAGTRVDAEGEELTGRAMREKGVAPGGAPAKASERRGTRKAGQKVAPAPDSRTLPSPIQALKASVKKAAGRKKSSRAGKSRR